MKTNRNKLRIIGLIFLSATLGMNSFAQKGKMLQNQCRMLPDLTDEQTEKISDLRTTHMQEMTKFRADMKVLRAELDKLSIAENADLKSINAKIDDITTVKNSMTKAQYMHRQEVRKLLTEEQRIVFDARAGKGFGPRHGYGRGQGQYQYSRNCIYNQNNKN